MIKALNYYQNIAEDESTHRPLEEEYSFYHAVREGDVDFVRKNIEDNVFSKPEGMGILSKDPLLNLKFHYVITAAMITRHCVEGGLELEQAYRLSDFYISKLDSCFDNESIANWHGKMVLDFTGKMNLLKKRPILSKSILLVTEYVYNHITKPITLEEVANAVQLSPCYISRLFTKETGKSFKDYVLEKKVEKAQNLLKYSEYSSSEIAQYLAFSSQSHFIQTFKHFTGMTPKKYKDYNSRTVW